MINDGLVRWFGEYVWDLRILSRRFDYAHQDADLSLLAPDWRDALCDRHALWPFDLMGVRASGYPGVFDRPGTAEYCTWEKFVTTVIGCLRRSTVSDLSSWERQWQSLAADDVESDPRYVAFRAVHDWVVLNARILGTAPLSAEDSVHDDPASCENPSVEELPPDPPDEPIGLIAGDPLVHMHHRGFPLQATPDSISLESNQVQDPGEAIAGFHHRGAFRAFAFLSLEHPLKAELMTPAGFLSHNEDVLKSIPLWHERPEDVIEQDPRYVAYRCGWDRLIITHLGFWRTFVQARTEPKVSRYKSTSEIDEFETLVDPVEDSGDGVLGLELCEPGVNDDDSKVN
jgi:hypothetical protein